MTILNLVAMLMFVVLPFVWFMVIGWAGFGLSKVMSTFNEASNPIGSGANSGANMGGNLVSKGGGAGIKELKNKIDKKR